MTNDINSLKMPKGKSRGLNDLLSNGGHFFLSHKTILEMKTCTDLLPCS